MMTARLPREIQEELEAKLAAREELMAIQLENGNRLVDPSCFGIDASDWKHGRPVLDVNGLARRATRAG